jgi:aspartyl-tRNA synthetase
MMNEKTSYTTTLRTHTCGELRAMHIGETVQLCGWVQSVRDMGKFAFAVLRDRYGLVQVTVYAHTQPELYQQLRKLGREYVLRVVGKVAEREAKNPNMPTGDVEVFPDTLEVLADAKLPPFLIEDNTDGNEELRMTYRYLDMRRNPVRQALELRAKMMRVVRNYLDEKGFLEVETPVMIKTTPEGARDFLVPSRLHPGSFYALAQSPQILKQLMMVGGIDRYYQICKCFRDEDFRGDRQPEFTQIDCEMAFVEQEDILRTFSGLVQHVYRELLNYEVGEVPRISYNTCLEKYGSDKPDLRFGCELVELNALPAIAQTEFVVFKKVLTSGGKILALNAEGCAGYTRKQLDALTDHAKHHGAGGLIWIRFEEGGAVKSSIDKFFDEADLREIGTAANAKAGDLLLIVADTTARARKVGGALRLKLGKDNGWIDESKWSIFWVVDFPLFERDEESGDLLAIHHPFVMPHPEDLDKLERDPEAVRAWCYDLVINGNELLSGSVRVHRRDIQARIFKLLNLSEEECEQKFGFLLRAFEYGAPPHAGCAFGFDRWAMLMAGGQTIRDVIAFPKNSAGRDLMLDAPAPADPVQLDDLHLRLKA